MSTRRKTKRRGPPILCQIRGCARVYPPGHPKAGHRIPFQTRGGLSSHRRRAHGLAKIGQRDRRPQDGRHRCTVPGCESLAPYRTSAGLGSHLRNRHGWVSDSPAALKKAAQRAKKRPPPRRPAGRLPDPPPSNGTPPPVPDPRRPRLTPGGREYVRLQALYLLNGNWAKALNASPAEVRDVLLELITNNFAPPKIKTTRVPAAAAYSRAG